MTGVSLMARPGSNDARRIANGARHADLSLAALSDEQARDLQEEIELRNGWRCSGCGRRIKVGFQFTSVDPRDADAPMVRLSACSRDDCGFAEQCRDGATVMELVEFVWLDANGPDAPPARRIVKRNERRAAAEAAVEAKPE